MKRAFTHDTPATRVLFGNGVRGRAADEADRLGASRVLVVAGPSHAALAGEVEGCLGRRVVGRYRDVVMHVPVEAAAKAVAMAHAVGADGVLAIGGGSAVGFAKAIAKESGLPIMAIPTTYAGSEMTSIWGLTEKGRKTTGRDELVLPRTVLYDPELTVNLPAALSAASGMNALAHLVEGLYAPEASPLLALTAEEGVRALASALPRVVADGADLEARADALYGAWLGGWILGTTTMGVHHKVCHTLGGTWNLPHAGTHSAVISYAVAFNRDAAPEAMAALVRALNAGGVPCTDAAEGLWDLAQRIGAPTSITDLGFSPADIDRAATIVVDGRPTNPRMVDHAGIRALIAGACDGARPVPPTAATPDT